LSRIFGIATYYVIADISYPLTLKEKQNIIYL